MLYLSKNSYLRIFVNPSPDVYFSSDRVQEGMRELEMLKDKRDVNLCSTMALILAHKKSRSVGK